MKHATPAWPVQHTLLALIHNTVINLIVLPTTNNTECTRDHTYAAKAAVAVDNSYP